jgi:hypothetical protein
MSIYDTFHLFSHILFPCSFPLNISFMAASISNHRPDNLVKLIYVLFHHMLLLLTNSRPIYSSIPLYDSYNILDIISMQPSFFNNLTYILLKLR